MKITSIRIQNYRTIEDLQIRFPAFYSALCGANDSGKTNVLRAIRVLMREEEGGYYPTEDEDSVSIKDDFPKWLETPPHERTTAISLSLQVEKLGDAALYQFVVRHLEISHPDEFLDLTLSEQYSSEKRDPKVTVTCLGKDYAGLQAEEVLNRLRTSRSVFFHNSTHSDRRLRFRDGVGRLKEIHSDGVALLEKLKGEANKTFKRIAKTQQEEIQTLLGRLEKKHKVSLSLPVLDFSWLPFSINLGEGKYDVPLDAWGSGTQNRTLILYTLFRARQIMLSAESAAKITPVIIVEEPESFLHPFAQAEFGNVLQDIAEEFRVQVIVSTHSPYMLSLKNPDSNVLLQRRAQKGQLRETQKIDTTGENWMAPFGQALGMDSEEFVPWKKLFGAQSNAILLVEGDIDREYFDLLRHEDHGTNRLMFDGEIIPYDGTGNLNNTVFLRFMRTRHPNVFVTFDLDQTKSVEPKLQAVGMCEGHDYCAIGIDSPGMRNIEGILPEHIRRAVFSDQPQLVQAATQGTSDEQKSARQKLKRLFLDAFKANANIAHGDYKGLYEVAKKINKRLAHS